MPDSFDYTTGTNSENVRLLQALIDEAPEYTEETNSRNANILKSIINNTEYTDAPQSEIEELLLRLKAKIGGEIEVDELNVTENGTYDAGVNKAYNPVNVELPLSSKTITANGTYTASDDNLAGYDEVTVAVEGYAKKSIANTPTAIATFNASALPMPSLTVGIEAVQSGTGDPSPTNVRPISGWSAVNVYDTGKNLFDTSNLTIYNRYINTANNTWVVTTDGSASVVFYCKPSTTYTLSYDHSEVTIFRTALINKDPSTITEQTVAVTNADGTISAHTITTSADTVAIIIQANRAVLTSATVKIQVELGTTATTYSPYNGTTYTTTLKDGQGNPMTCYGGTLSNENGVQSLENVRGHVVYDGSNDEAWGNYSSNYNGFPIIISGSNINATDPSTQLMCDKLAVSTVRGPSGESPIKTYTSTSDNNAIFVSIEGITDKADFLTYLSNNNIEIVYPLTTPQQITQDSLSIATQEGTNNLWADSGDVQSGEYLEAL